VRIVDFNGYIARSGLAEAASTLTTKGYVIRPSERPASQFRAGIASVPSRICISTAEINCQEKYLRILIPDISDFDIFCTILSHELGHAIEHSVSGDWMDEMLAWERATGLFENGTSRYWFQIKEHSLNLAGYRWNINRHAFNDEALTSLSRNVDTCPFCPAASSDLAHFPQIARGIIDLWVWCVKCDNQYLMRFKPKYLYKAFRIDNVDHVPKRSFGQWPFRTITREVAVLFTKQHRKRRLPMAEASKAPA
jgi:hypothetical protein